MNGLEFIPNRIFVGGLPNTTNEEELKEYFGNLSDSCSVKEANIIASNEGASKIFGFVTFETEADASKILALKSDSLSIKDHKINIAHAFHRVLNVKNQSNRGFYYKNGYSSDIKNPSQANSSHSSEGNRLYISSKNSNNTAQVSPSIRYQNVDVISSSKDISPLSKSSSDSPDSEAAKKPDKKLDENRQNSVENENFEKGRDSEIEARNCKKFECLDKEDDNNNIIKLDSPKLLEGTLTELNSDSIEKSTAIPVIKKDSNNNHYPVQSTKRFNDSRKQLVNNQRGSDQSNNSGHYYSGQKTGSKTYHSKQFPKSYYQQLMNHQNTSNPFVQYHYAMTAAALTSTNVHSPIHQQQQQKNPSLKTSSMSSQRPNQNSQYKIRHNNDSKITNTSKSSNEYAGSMINMHSSHHGQNVSSAEFPGHQNGNPNANHQNMSTNQINSNQNFIKNGVAYYNQGFQNHQQTQSVQNNGFNSFHSVNTTGNGVSYSQAQSIPSCSSSSSSSGTSGNQNLTNNIQINSAQSQSYSNNSDPNSMATSYVNYSATVNPNAGVAPFQMVNNLGALSTIPSEQVSNGQFIVPPSQQQQCSAFPNYCYYPVNQVNIQNKEISQSNIEFPLITPRALSPHSQQNAEAYCPKSIPAPNIQQENVPTAEIKNNPYLQSNSTVSTITNAFETAINSFPEQVTNNQTQVVSTENLEQMMRKNLTLQPPIVYYIAQPEFSPNAQPVHLNNLPQCYYYYGPNQSITPNAGLNYQAPQVLIPPPNQGMLVQQPMAQINGNYTQTMVPNSYPIQMNSNGQMPVNYQLVNEPLVDPVVQTNYPGKQNPSSGGAPLLQLSSFHYQTQHPANSFPLQQNNTLNVQQQKQLVSPKQNLNPLNTMKSQQQSKTQYQPLMYQGQISGPHSFQQRNSKFEMVGNKGNNLHRMSSTSNRHYNNMNRSQNNRFNSDNHKSTRHANQYSNASSKISSDANLDNLIQDQVPLNEADKKAI